MSLECLTSRKWASHGAQVNIARETEADGRRNQRESTSNPSFSRVAISSREHPRGKPEVTEVCPIPRLVIAMYVLYGWSTSRSTRAVLNAEDHRAGPSHMARRTSCGTRLTYHTATSTRVYARLESGYSELTLIPGVLRGGVVHHALIINSSFSYLRGTSARRCPLATDQSWSAL